MRIGCVRMGTKKGKGWKQTPQHDLDEKKRWVKQRATFAFFAFIFID